MKHLEVENVSKKFGHKYVLRNVSFSITQGESVALVGANGAGKSTLLKIILGVINTCEGSLRLMGQEISDPGSRQNVGYLPELPGYWPELSAVELLSYMGQLRSIPQPILKSRIEKLLNAFGLAQRGHGRMATYSKGMLQRSGLALALLHDPRFLILDEPMSGLDPRAQEKLKAVLKELKREGRTLLISSHSLEDVRSLCDRVLLLEKSELKADGPTEEVLTKLIEEYRRSEPWDEDPLGDWKDVFK